MKYLQIYFRVPNKRTLIYFKEKINPAGLLDPVRLLILEKILPVQCFLPYSPCQFYLYPVRLLDPVRLLIFDKYPTLCSYQILCVYQVLYSICDLISQICDLHSVICNLIYFDQGFFENVKFLQRSTQRIKDYFDLVVMNEMNNINNIEVIF